MIQGHPSRKIGIAANRSFGYAPARMKLEEIAREASKLPEKQRAALASQLLHGLETPVYDVSDDEVFRRMREAEADPSVLISFDELVAGLRKRGA